MITIPKELGQELVQVLFGRKIQLKDRGHKFTGRVVKSYYSDFADNTPIPKEIFEKGELKPFESIMANVPQGYDEYLERLYGDYMKLPPLEKRVSNHNAKVIDVNKSYKEYINK